MPTRRKAPTTQPTRRKPPTTSPGSSQALDDQDLTTVDELRDADSLYWNAIWQAEVLAARIEAHLTLARRSDFISKLSAWVLTFTAGVSTLTIFAEMEWAAAIFAIITTAISALKLAFDPAGSAKNNREAATRYQRLMPQLSDIQIESRPNTVYNPQTERYEDGRIAGTRLGQAWRDYNTIRLTTQEISESAPLVKWEAVYDRNQKAAEKYWQEQEQRPGNVPQPPASPIGTISK